MNRRPPLHPASPPPAGRVVGLALAHPAAPAATPTLALLAVLALAAHATPARAEAWGTVLSSTPIVVSTPVVQRECSSEPARREGAREPIPEGGIGAVAGAVVGAALGNAVGSGSGRALATGIGMIAGAALGNHAQAQEAREARESQRQAEAVTRCRDVTRNEARTVGYDVVYEYQGVQRSVRLAQAPGDRIPLQVQVVPAGAIDGPLPGAAAPAAPAAPPAYRMPAPAYDNPPPAPRVYRTPADNRVDDEAWRRADEPPPSAPVVREASNPVPYLIVGGITALAIAHAIRSDRPHRHPPRWRHR